MAVEIPVVIDIDKAFEDAARRVGVAMKPLQDYVDENALKVRLKIDNTSSKSLEAILKDASLSSSQLNTALADVERRIQRIASRKGSFDMVNGLTEKESSLIQAYTILQRKITGIGNTSTATQKIISVNISKVQKEIDKLSAKLKTVEKGTPMFKNLNNKLIQAKQNLAGLNAELAKVRTQDPMAGLDASLTQSNSKLVTLIKNSIRLVAIHSATRFVRNIREVTAEFELQRVALGGIIQDTEQANLLFRQIKAAAIESPFQIKDLVSYTKQLSAYRVETENLFDVTMQLADVSAGLGVDMSRLILAYGQVRAASVLRGQELRQFTEAGIPLVDLLAKKFQELNGRMVSTGEVFELISKRAVPFEMIAEIFEDMTSKGGTFYKMQQKQAETLAGQWANLRDAVSIMYDEIGNTAIVHGAMERLIGDAKNLMLNWRSVGTVIKSVGIQFAAMKLASLFIPTLTFNTKLAEKATLAKARATELEAAQQAKANIVRGITIAQLNTYSKYMTKAAAAQTLFGRGLKQLAANFLGGGWVGVAITAISALVGWFVAARNEANRLNKEIEKIGTEGSIQINRSVSNFYRLADAAVNASEGSNEQNEALAELKRTYSDIIPEQDLQIKKLIELKGNYESLTSAIEQKINMQIREQKINATTDAYSTKITKNRKKTKNLLLQYGLDKEQINAVMDEVQRAVDEGLLGIESTAFEKRQVFKNAIKDLTGIVVDFSNGFRDYEGRWHSVSDRQGKVEKSLVDLADTYIELHSEVAGINKEMDSSVGTMGVYADSWKKLQESIKGVTVSEAEFGKSISFTYKKEKVRKQVELMAKAIEDAFAGTEIDISDAFKTSGAIDFKVLSEAAEGSTKWGLQGFIKNVQKSYESLVPTNKMVGVVERKFQELANTVGISMDDVQGYLLRGEKSMKDYTKEIASELEEAKHKVGEFQLRMEDFKNHPGVALPVSDEDVSKANALVQFLTLLSDWLAQFAKQTRNTSHQTDPWITNMQERIKFMQDFKKGYDDLKKYISSSEALGEEASIMLGRGMSLGLTADQQTRAAEDLSSWYDEMIKTTVERLRSKGLSGATATDLLGIDTTKRSKDIQDLQKLLQTLWDAKTDFDITQKKKDLEDALKRLSDEIKRSDTARNFYQNILDLTGDEQLAATMGVSVYGDIGAGFRSQMQKQLNAALGSLDPSALTDELRSAFAGQDFNTILKNLDKFPEEWQKRLKEMASDNEKFNADRVKDLFKALQNAKSYGEKRVELAKQTAQRTAEIEAMNVPDNVKEQLRLQNTRKEAEEAAKLQYEAFKETPMYVELFADLEAASTRMLKNMRGQLEAMKTNWKDLHPRELKELQSRLDELDKQLANKNPFKALVTSIKEYRDLQRAMSRRDAEMGSITSDVQMQAEKAVLDAYTKEYELAKDLYGEEDARTQIAKDRMEAQADIVDFTIDEAEASQEVANQFRRAGKHIQDAAEALQKWSGYMNDTLSAVGEVIDTFGSSDTSETFGIISDGISKTVGGAASAASGLARVFAGDISGVFDVIKGAANMISGIFGTKKQLEVKSLNKQIDDQQHLLNELEYSYGRLERAMEKSFGSDYIYNYNEQLETLVAKQAAYEEQARLEREKGKKADQDKIRDYENSARDVADQILDMRSQLSEFFTGTDLSSAAQDFADAWIDAYKEFSSTTDAMSEKFNDMIQNMISRSLAAKVMQEMLAPIFDQIDSLAEDGLLSTEDIAEVAALAQERIPMINEAMTNLMTSLAAAGYDVKTQTAGLSGISKGYATASEESILGLAAAVNTQNFYISYVPTISENVSQILATMTGGVSATGPVETNESGDVIPSVQRMIYDHLPNMDQNLSEMLRLFRSVITTKNATTNTAYIAVK